MEINNILGKVKHLYNLVFSRILFISLFVILLLLITLIPSVSAANYYYNTSSTVTGGWNRGTGTTYTEIVDSALEPTAAGTSAFVASRLNDGFTSEFGFSSVSQNDIENITLWVYTATESTAQYTFELRQGATTRCSNLIGGATPFGWKNCTWTNPSGDLSDLRIYLSVVSRGGGGGPSNAIVYSTYIDVDTGYAPPNVILTTPDNDSTVFSKPFDFQFNVTDETFSNMTYCDLYTNFTGAWINTSRLNDVQNNTLNNFTVNPGEGKYEWNVLCNNSDKVAFASSNRTVTINGVVPLIKNSQFNDSSIRQNRSVTFSTNITDNYGIGDALITLKYPNNTNVNLSLNPSGDIYSVDINNTINPGTYSVELIWANDTLGQIGSNYSPSLSFEVLAISPDEFDLLTPSNNLETVNVTPFLTWEQTATPDFKNYTVQISTDSDFSSIEFSYYKYFIDNTSHQMLVPLNNDTTYYWKVIAYDVFGNSRNSTSTLTYITDNTAPNVSLDIPSDLGYSINPYTDFYFTPDETNTIDQCLLYTNTSGWSSKNSSSSIAKGFINSLSSIILEGPNLWNVLCYDLAGNSDYAVGNYTVILDTKGPLINLTSPENNSLINTTNVVNFVAQSNDSLSNLSTCGLYINASNIENVSSENGVPFNFTTFLDNGYYEWYVQCWDEHNNSNISATYNLNVSSLDNDAPIVNLVDPADNDYLSSSTYLFNYSVGESTGIQFCDFYLDDVFETNSTVVDKSGYNFFSISGLTGPSHNWRIECVDNSSEHNRGISDNRTFWVDLIDPNVELKSPDTFEKFNQSLVFFDYVPTDDNLDYCDFYSNETGTFKSQVTENSPISGSTNSFNNILNDGTYIWNVLCFDLAGRSNFGSNNRTISIDTISPQYSNINVTPTSPFNYSNRTYVFNITWTDGSGVDGVFIEHNFSGSLNTYEINSSSNNVYSYNISNISVGTYFYSWNANDTFGNINQTNSLTYIVNKSDPQISLYLNGTQGNITINESSPINITGLIGLPSGGELFLYVYEMLENQSFSEVRVNHTFVNPGLYNVTLKYQGDSNYNSDEITYFVTVLDITSPSVTLLSPANGTTVNAGSTNLQYSVNDFSNIDSCSLYINDTFEDISYSITKDSLQHFTYTTLETSYFWRVECNDSYSNNGISETRYFNATEISDLMMEVSLNKTSVEVGEHINVSYNVTDLYTNPLVANVSSSVIDVNTSVPWWDDGYSNRRVIYLNETLGENQSNSLAEVNITGLSGISDCSNDIRIINHSDLAGDENPFLVLDGDDSTWCHVAFEVNLLSNEVNNVSYYVYYNNPSPSATNYDFDVVRSTSYFATESASDEGTVTNVANIIGFTDSSFGRMSQANGGATISGHGRGLISNPPVGTAQNVDVRYRYQVPAADSMNWYLRYSVNDGTSYVDALTGSTITSKLTSSWYNITSAYSNLQWSTLNSTRLQGRMVKSGGGQPATLDLFWVEMNVTYRVTTKVSEFSLGIEESLVDHYLGETAVSGLLDWDWNTSGISKGNYSLVSLAIKDGYNSYSNKTTIEIKEDITSPNVTLVYPYDSSKISKGLTDFNFTVYDTNIDNCTLYIGNSTFEPNVTQSASNGVNQFTNINLDYGNYTWNVLCTDFYGHSDFAERNFSFKVIVPTPNVSTTINQTDFTLSWEAIPDADSYNIYISNDYSQGFDGTPNETGITDNNFTFSSTSNIKFYKITAVVGDIESDEASYAGYSTESFEEGFNFVSFPFLQDNYTLKNATNDGFEFKFDTDCLLSLWKYDSTTQSYDRTDWVNGYFVPATGSEDFTQLDSQAGYFTETNSSCNLKIGGRVPVDNESYNLGSGVNSVSWLSVEEKTLPTSYDPSLINTVPANSVRIINRFNSSTQLFEITTFFFDGTTPWGWWPSFNNQHFTSLVPGEAYYFESQGESVWNHQP